MFGPAQWSENGLTVYKTHASLVASIGRTVPAYRLVDMPPRVSAAKTAPGMPRLAGSSIAVGAERIALPNGFRPTENHVANASPRPFDDDLSGSPTVEVRGVPPLAPLQLTGRTAPRAEFPDWTSYLIIDGSCKSGATFKASISDIFEGSRRGKASCTAGKASVLLATEGIYRNVKLRANHPIVAAWTLDAAYAPLVLETAGVKNGHEITIRLPIAAELGRGGTPLVHAPFQTYANSPVRLQFRSPIAGMALLPFVDSPLWRFNGAASTRSLQRSGADRLVEVGVHPGDVNVTYLPDRFTRAGALMSLFALLSLTAVLLPRRRRLIDLGRESFGESDQMIQQFYESRRTDLPRIDARLATVLEEVVRLRPASLLDVACGYGAFLSAVRARLPGTMLSGCDIVQDGVDATRALGIDAVVANVEKGLPYDDESFDCIFFGEVIEHLVDPDRAVLELSRVLRRGGVLIVTTPNLASWFNRILLLAGIQPVFTETSLHVNLGRITPALGQGKQAVGHLKIFTLRALREMLGANGFDVLRVYGAPFPDKTPVAWFDRKLSRIPSLSSNFIVVAKNVRTLRSNYRIVPRTSERAGEAAGDIKKSEPAARP